MKTVLRHWWVQVPNQDMVRCEPGATGAWDYCTGCGATVTACEMANMPKDLWNYPRSTANWIQWGKEGLLS